MPAEVQAVKPETPAVTRSPAQLRIDVAVELGYPVNYDDIEAVVEESAQKERERLRAAYGEPAEVPGVADSEPPEHGSHRQRQDRIDPTREPWAGTRLRRASLTVQVGLRSC